MYATDVAVIGGGQAGLAMSHGLAARGMDHIVFERAQIASRWTSDAWDSLRLLTPNWLNMLPGMSYEGDLDGFMTRDAFVERLRTYAAGFAAPVLAGTRVLSVEPLDQGFLLRTRRGTWKAGAVVVATGHCDIASMPSLAGMVEAYAPSLHSSQYRSPAALPAGHVLVVGASASGVQIADELRRSGRDVTLAVGRHTTLPRTWRGLDIHAWLHLTGTLSQRATDIANLEAAMREPAPQLAGRPDRADVNLAALQQRGVRLAGRVEGVEMGVIQLGDNLEDCVSHAEARQQRVLDQFDAFAHLEGSPKPELPRVDFSRPAPRRIAMRGDNIGAVIWATGYRRDFSWLKLPVHTAQGEIAHRDGVTVVPGIYALGLKLLRKRDSHFIGGVGSDARFIAGEVCGFLQRRGRKAA